jgi:hypothetical protein
MHNFIQNSHMVPLALRTHLSIASFCIAIYTHAQINNTTHVEDIAAQYSKTQDSLRNVLLSNKPDEQIKQSVFQELYIRNVINVTNNVLLFTIHLNLHAWDCGASDDYSNTLTFTIQKEQLNTIPNKLTISEKTHGEKIKTTTTQVKLELIKQRTDFIIYHNEKMRKTLIIFKNIDKVGTALYYFQNLAKSTLQKKDVYAIIKEATDSDDAPFRAHVLQEPYEHFLQ